MLSETVKGVVELVAGGLEWLRRYSLGAEEVQSKVNGVKRKSTEHKDHKVLQAVLRQTHEVADPDNIKHLLDPNKFIG